MNSSAPKPGTSLSLFLRWSITLFAIGLLIYLLSNQGWGEISAAVRQISWSRFVFVLGLTFISRLAVTGRWFVLLRSAGLPISTWQAIRITFAGLFASNFLPTTIGGDVVRLGGALRLKYDQAVCLASLVVDRLVGMAGMSMAVPFVLPVLGKGFSLNRDVRLVFMGLPLIASLEPPQESWLQRSIVWLKRELQRFTEAVRLWVHRPLNLLWALCFSWGHMLCLFGSIWVLLNGMGDPLPLWMIAGLWAVTYFVTLLPISINGIGVQELSMVFMFVHFGGITQTSGLTLALLMRVLLMLVSLPGAFFLSGMLMGDR